MQRRAIPAFVLLSLFAVFAWSQARLNVSQVIAFIESSIKLKHPDRQVADYLKKVKLSESLDEVTIETLQGQGAGPRTLEALRLLADAAKDLPAPKPVAAKPPPPEIPPPSAKEQREVIENARQYALSYSKRLPDFICVQVTRRYADPTGLEFWQRQDVITERLSYFEQKEDYKVVLVNNQPTSLTHDQLGGATSSGEFGSMLHEIFDHSTETDFRWTRWATLRGRRAHVYTYRVSQPRSKLRIDYQKQMSIIAGYTGLVYVDADMMTVMRITYDAAEIPPSFPIQQARTQLDYDFIKIGEAEHVLPLRAEVRMREGRILVKNEVEFRLYRKFGADAVIKFDTPEPLSEEMIKEKPAEAPPAKPVKPN